MSKVMGLKPSRDTLRALGAKLEPERMNIEEFGSALIMTRDLDPVYVALHGAKLEKAQLYRWLLAYWCFYHMGAASYLSEYGGPDFWNMMDRAAENASGPPVHNQERWPRASERRYFRGSKCVRAVGWLRNRWPEPEGAVAHVAGMSSGLWADNVMGFRTEKTVMEVIGEWPLFGPWIGFKAADMLERCAGIKIQFSPDIGLVYKEPRATLDILVEQRGGTPQERYAEVSEYFRATPAPPALDRGCGPQEVETILCKWKSHLAGRYTVGKDILEVRHALVGWGETAERLRAAAPEEVEK